MLDGLGGDVYVRMARNVAEEFGFIKPSALYLRMVRSLTIYHDPRTGSAVEVMTNRVPPGSITYRDDADEVRRRIGRAYTGGRQTLEEQRRLGGNPDPRVCGVASLHAFHATTGASDFAELQRQCRAGELLCGQCKASATGSPDKIPARAPASRAGFAAGNLAARPRFGWSGRLTKAIAASIARATAPSTNRP